MIKKSISLTAEGKKELEKELNDLIKNRPVIAEKIATARAFGDLSENEEYSSARNEQKLSESRILEIQDILKNAKIIRAGKKDKVRHRHFGRYSRPFGRTARDHRETFFRYRNSTVYRISTGGCT